MFGKPDFDPFGLPVAPHPDIVHVLHVGQHDVVAGFQVEGVRRDVEPFGGVFHECELARLRAQQFGHQAARGFDVLARPRVFAGVVVNVAAVLLHRPFDAARRDGFARDVEVGPVGESREFIAQCCPVGWCFHRDGISMKLVIAWEIQSGLILACLMTCAQRASSRLMWAANSAGVPPARLSTTNCWPSAAVSLLPIMRAIVSFPPPDGKGTIKRIGRAG